jgi:excisionase family DNA binding protein
MRLSDPPQFITTTQLSRRLGIHPSTLRRWIKGGLVPAPMLVNRVARWPEKAIAAWIAARSA